LKIKTIFSEVEMSAFRFARPAVLCGLMLAGLSGCAAQNQALFTPLALPDGFHKLAAINLVVQYTKPSLLRDDADVMLTVEDVAQVVAVKVRDAGMFAGVEYGTGPNLYTMRLVMREDCPQDLGHAMENLVSAASLSIIPRQTTCNYILNASFFGNGQTLADRTYIATHAKTTEVLAKTPADASVEGYDEALAKMVADFAANPPIPLAQQPTAAPAKPGSVTL
jgi:hypothetical protein